jgi:hypothetical protein
VTVQAFLHLYKTLSGPNSYAGTIGLTSAPLDVAPVYWPVLVSYDANIKSPGPNIQIFGRGINTFLNKKLGFNIDAPQSFPPPPSYSLWLVGYWDGSTKIGSNSGGSGSGGWVSGQWLNLAEAAAGPPPASSTPPATTTWYTMSLWDNRTGKNRYINVPFMLSSSSLAQSTTKNYAVMGLPGLSTPPTNWPDPTLSYWASSVFIANFNSSGYHPQLEGPSAYLEAALGITILPNARFKFWAQQASASSPPQGTAAVPTQWLDSTALASLWISGTPPVISGNPSPDPLDNMVWTTAVNANFNNWQQPG